jgi:hypothetical protein
VRELVGARNLDIFDVYDTDANGKTKKAVSRVFHTQGQSLIFYMYDLSACPSEPVSMPITYGATRRKR